MTRVLAFLRRHLLTMLGALVLLTVVVVLWSVSAPLAQRLRFVQPSDVVTFLGEHLLAAAVVGGCLLILALIWLPKWQAARPELTSQARFEVENNARKTIAEIVGGVVLLVGLYFTGVNLQVTQETATKDRELTREGQITERFTKAVEQLGNDKLQIRLGGIYALERIAGESGRDHWLIMEVLTAYVREHAPWPPQSPKNTPPPQDHPSPKGDPAAAQEQPLPKLATDIQAVLTVLGRRDRTYEKDEQNLDLRRTDLHHAHLRGAHLEGTALYDAHLEGANLGYAYLKGAALGRAHLRGVNLRDAQLQGAIFHKADQQDAKLRNVQLWLDAQQLCTAYTLYGAQLDPLLTEQVRQQCPKLLEEPQE